MKKYILLMFLLIGLQVSFSVAFAAQSKGSLTSQNFPDYYCVESSIMSGADDKSIRCNDNSPCVIGEERKGYCNTPGKCPQNEQYICWEHYYPKPKTK